MDYSYSTTYSEEFSPAFFGPFFAFFIIIYLIIFAVSIATIVIELIYAKKQGIRNYGLLLLPIGREYIMGQMADVYENKNARKKFPILGGIFYGVVLLGAIGLSIALITMTISIDAGTLSDSSAVSLLVPMLIGYFVLFALEITYMVFYYIYLYRIFCAKNKNQGVMWLLLSIFIPFCQTIFFLVYMNKPSYSRAYQEAAERQPIYQVPPPQQY
ncbi:MAG: hypothetical protein LBS74_06555 [Oscillospiraceae bacterium]|jgi:hypothetical protein|nr:hypothetical protein [Oscillospiraceae bacterium]